MTDLKVELLPWQQEVYNDPTRFKVIAAGRRTGKSRLAAWSLILNCLSATKGQVFYVAPTQGQARDIMWQMLLELGHSVIASSHVNNLQIKFINGALLTLKGADRPETMRGVSLKFLVMDEYADMKPEVWEQILRPALADQKGDAMFIGTPMGRNHFYDLYQYASVSEDETFKGYHYTSFDNPLLDPKEIEAAEKSMSAFSFRQEFMASLRPTVVNSLKKKMLSLARKSLLTVSIILPWIWLDLQTFKKSLPKLKDLIRQALLWLRLGLLVGGLVISYMGAGALKRPPDVSSKRYETINQLRLELKKGALKNAVAPYLERPDEEQPEILSA